MWAAYYKAKKDIPLTYKESESGKEIEYIVEAGSQITLTKGIDQEFALWIGFGIYDLPNEYVGEFVKTISESSTTKP